MHHGLQSSGQTARDQSGESAAFEVLAVLPAFNGGGAERVLLNLTSGLRDRDHKVGLLVFAGGGPFAHLASPNIALHCIGTGSLRNSLLLMARTIWALRPRVVLSTFGYVNLGLLAIKPLLPRETEVWVREANLPSISLPNNRYRHLMRLGYWLLYRWADRVICSSVRMRDELVCDFGVEPARVRVLPNPVDEDAIRRSAGPVVESQRAERRFVAAGRLTHQKGFDLLLEMFALPEFGDARLSILGDGPMSAELARRAFCLGITDRVCFTGFAANPWHYFAGADAFLLPSRWEGMPNAVLEALACGVPVIATPESGGIAEIAAVAPPGAVTVVAAGQPFVEAMRRVVPRDSSLLRPSLLPPRYRLESVLDSFEQWLDESA